MDLKAAEKQHGHRMLPMWQRENALRCEGAMVRLLQNNARLSRLAQSAIGAGRKLRASLALQCIRWTSVELAEANEPFLLDVLAKAEMLHSASCILDDIIDGDTLRRGQPVFHVREGLPQAILTAQELIAVACQSEETHPIAWRQQAQAALIESVRESIGGEACDSFPFDDTVKFYGGVGKIEGAYLKKTTPGFAVAFKLVGIATELGEQSIDRFARFGEALGAYYQYANDYHDWFTLDAACRGEMEDSVLVSLCMPTIAAVDRVPEVRKMIGARITRTEMERFVSTLREEGICEICQAKVNAARERVLALFPGVVVPAELKYLLAGIDSKEFWGYKYTI